MKAKLVAIAIGTVAAYPFAVWHANALARANLHYRVRVTDQSGIIFDACAEHQPRQDFIVGDHSKIVIDRGDNSTVIEGDGLRLTTIYSRVCGK